MNQQILDYIQAATAAGHDRATITETLMSQGGWQREDIEATFAAMTAPQAPVSPVEVSTEVQPTPVSATPAAAPAPVEPVLTPAPTPVSDPVATESVRVEPKPNKKLTWIVGGNVVLLCIALTSYLVWANFGTKGPLNEDTFAAQLVAGYMQMNSFDTQLQLQMFFEPRDSDAVPLELESDYITMLNSLTPDTTLDFDLYMSSDFGLANNWEIRVDASANYLEESFNVAGDARLVDESLYARIRTAPAILAMFYPVPIDQWVRFPFEGVTDFLGSASSETLEDLSEEELLVLSAAVQAIDDSGIIEVVDITTESLNDEKVYRYQIEYQLEKLPDFYARLYDNVDAVRAELTLEVTREEFLQEVENLAASYEDVIPEDLRDEIQISVVVNEAGFPVQTELNARLVPPNEVAALSDLQFKVIAKSTFSNINEPVSVTAPDEYIEYEDVMQEVIDGPLLNTQLFPLEVTVFFAPGTADDSIDDVVTGVQNIPGISNVTLTSAEEALLQYRERNKYDEIAMQALNNLDNNPLGAFFTAEISGESAQEDMLLFLESQDKPSDPWSIIEEINYAGW